MKYCFYFLFLTAYLITGCVSATKQTDESSKHNAAVKVNPSKEADAIGFLSFSESFSNLPADSQKKVYIETNQALSINPNDISQRVKLVMIYGLPSSSLLDTPKAQSLLQKILQEDILTNSQLAFANLLFDHLVAINKTAKNNNGDQKRVDILQQKNDTLQSKLDSTQLKLETAQQKLDAAQQQLDELKKIEKSMGQRDAMPKK